MIDAVLWDNDGVLVDTETLFFEMTREAFASVEATLTPQHWASAYLGEGRRSRDLARELGIPESRIDPMLDARNARYRQRLAGEIPIRAGVRETLTTLKGCVRLALVTGSPGDQLRLMHQHTGLLNYFEILVASEDYQRSKPHPDAYLEALRRLNMAADHCLAVEDSPRGVRSAAAAGIRCLLVPHALTDVDGCRSLCQVAPGVSAVLDMVNGG